MHAPALPFTRRDSAYCNVNVPTSNVAAGLLRRPSRIWGARTGYSEVSSQTCHVTRFQ